MGDKSQFTLIRSRLGWRNWVMVLVSIIVIRCLFLRRFVLVFIKALLLVNLMNWLLKPPLLWLPIILITPLWVSILIRAQFVLNFIFYVFMFLLCSWLPELLFRICIRTRRNHFQRREYKISVCVYLNSVCSKNYHLVFMCILYICFVDSGLKTCTAMWARDRGSRHLL